jgi:hypothetical protein
MRFDVVPVLDEPHGLVVAVLQIDDSHAALGLPLSFARRVAAKCSIRVFVVLGVGRPQRGTPVELTGIKARKTGLRTAVAARALLEKRFQVVGGNRYSVLCRMAPVGFELRRRGENIRRRLPEEPALLFLGHEWVLRVVVRLGSSIGRALWFVVFHGRISVLQTRSGTTKDGTDCARAHCASFVVLAADDEHRRGGAEDTCDGLCAVVA